MKHRIVILGAGYAGASVAGGRLAAGYKELICEGAAYMVAHPLPYPVRRRRTARQPETAPATISV